MNLWTWLKSHWEPRESAWVLFYTRDKILLGKRSKNSRRPGEWNFIGGRIDDGESPRDSAIREAYEEAGLHLVPIHLRALGHLRGHHYFAYRLETEMALAPSEEIQKFAFFNWNHLPKRLHPKTQRYVNEHGKKWWMQLFNTR